MHTLAQRAYDEDRRTAGRTWGRLLDDAAFRAQMPDAVVRGQPYLSFNALVLTPDETRTLKALTETFAAIFVKAVAAMARDTEAVRAMGFPWAAAELLADEPDTTLLFGRFDWGLHPERGWQLFEFNSDTPSGLREAVVADTLLHRRIGAGTRRLSHRLNALLCTAVDRTLADFRQRTGNAVRTLGLVTQASYEEDLAQIVFMKDLLERHWSGWADAPVVVPGDLGNLWIEGDDVLLLGERLDALYRLYPFERLYGHPVFAPLFEQVTAGRLCLLNGLRGFLPQSKGVLAWLWEQRDSVRFTRRERAAIRDHLPPTFRLAETPAGPRDRWIVKEFFGREGEEVYRGGAMSESDWARCLGWGTFVAQEWVETVEVAGIAGGPGQSERTQDRVSVGSFVVDGRFAGCYSRAGGAVIDVNARYLATFAAP